MNQQELRAPSIALRRENAATFFRGAERGHETRSLRIQFDAYLATTGRFFAGAFADLNTRRRSNYRTLRFRNPDQ